jgi:hypothetical protein
MVNPILRSGSLAINPEDVQIGKCAGTESIVMFHRRDAEAAEMKKRIGKDHYSEV